MKKTKRFISVVLAMILTFSVCALGFSANAAARLTKIEVIQEPEQLKFYKGTDWDYGEWGQPGENEWIWYEGDRISFLRNPGGGYYQDGGMINANGLVIKAYYSDGTTKNIEYKETTLSSGVITQNIIISPEKGAYKVGKMKVEVWMEIDYRIYDTYEIEIIDGPAPQRQMGDVNDDDAVNSADALLILQHSVSIITLDSAQKTYADMNSDNAINSSDALRVLQKSVGI